MTLLKNLEDGVRRNMDVGTEQARAEVRSRVIPAQQPPSEPHTIPQYNELRGETFQEDLVAGALWSRDCAPRQSRLGGEWLHVSSLPDLCVRASVLAHRYMRDHVVGDDIRFSRVTFTIGSAIEKHVKDTLVLGDNRVPAMPIYGMWTCRSRHQRTARIVGPNDEWPVCGECGQQERKYEELTLRNPEHRLVGRPDLVLVPQMRAFVPLEVKSMATNRWNELTRPVADHVLQVLMYWWLLRETQHAVADEVRLLYVCKDWMRRSPYKEFIVDPRSSVANGIIESALEVAREFARCAGDEGAQALPPRTICNVQTCRRARDCPVSTLCFELPRNGV